MRYLLSLGLVVICLVSLTAQTRFPERNIKTPGEIILALEKLNTVGSVLYLAAHPDDENQRLISYLANERKVRTGYLSLTRGDGGQNLIGTEKGPGLGLLRTQELLEARRVDGGEQFFSRAMDFGYSKSPEETFEVWGKEEILADVVWVIRKFKPDVIITRFPTTGEGGHGHHTASAILANEAFDKAADAEAFSWQIDYVDTWQTERVLWNSFSWRRSEEGQQPDEIKVETGLYNPLLGESYGEIAMAARSKHRCQGFGTSLRRGAVTEYVKNIKGSEIKEDILEGIDLSWNRLKGGASIGAEIEKVIQGFSPKNPAASVAKLVQIRKAIKQLENEHWREQKLAEVDAIIFACLGLYAEATTEQGVVVAGQELAIDLEVINRSEVNVTLNSVDLNEQSNGLNQPLLNNEDFKNQLTFSLSEDALVSQPLWLTNEPLKGIFPPAEETKVDDPELLPLINAQLQLNVAGEEMTLSIPVKQKRIDRDFGERYIPISMVPPAVVNLPETPVVFSGKEGKTVLLTVQGNVADITTQLSVSLPKGWKASWEDKEVQFVNEGEIQLIPITLTPPKKIKDPVGFVQFYIEVNGLRYSYQQKVIDYDHIQRQMWFPEAKMQVSYVGENKVGGKLGYIPGAGDNVADALSDLGYSVETLDNEALLTANLADYKTILVGIRAYNKNEKLGLFHDKLMEYVEQGGNLIVQYQTSNFLGTVETPMGPYPIELGRGRVTKEEAPITVLKPEHPVFNTPNTITETDFENWAQERGLYFAQTWDTKYTPLVQMNDPDSEPLRGALMHTVYGKGNFYYTGISFFRQLPKGVPGAYRLLVNLIETPQNP